MEPNDIQNTDLERDVVEVSSEELERIFQTRDW